MKNLLLSFCLATVGVAQNLPYVALGDSLGEGVQSGDASLLTQLNAYPYLIARQMRVNFPAPAIVSNPFGFVGVVSGRTRLSPAVAGANLAVSGADSTSILKEQAGFPILTETDLVLQPRIGSQVEIAEAMRAPFMTCWIGNNDALSTVLAFDQLDTSQLTPIPVFAANYHEIVQRLTRWGAKVVVANIPNVTEIGFLIDRQDLIRLTGNDWGLPANSFTTFAAVILFKLGLADASLLQNPDWVMDPSEAQIIQNAIAQYNQIIAQEASAVGIPVVNMNGLLESIHKTGLPIGSIVMNTRYLGGIFSLDGVHPSNIGQAIVANAFIKTANEYFGMNTPLLSGIDLATILFFDPFVDFDGDGKVPGRPLGGLIETLAPFLGISGDLSQFRATSKVDASAAHLFMQQYFTAKGLSPLTPWSQAHAIQALRDIFAFNRGRWR